MNFFEDQLENAKPLEETDDQIVEERKDYFGDKFVVGDFQLFALIYNKKAEVTHIQEFEVSNFQAEIVSLTPRSLDMLNDEFDFGGMTGTNNNLPRFYEKGMYSSEVLKRVSDYE